MKNLENKPNFRAFLLLFSSQSISTMGSAMTSYALMLWVYKQEGTATSIAMLSAFTHLPSILLCFLAGSIADRWDKKRILLICDLLAALATVFVFAMLASGRLLVWHLYAVNFTISLMNAFQNPASYVAVGLLTPEGQHARVSGMQGLSASMITIIAPAFATALMAYFGIESVFIVDLLTFAAAFLMLLFGIRLTEIHREVKGKASSLLRTCLDGFRFLRKNRAVLSIILFFSLINFLAYTAAMGGVLSAMILARSGGSDATLGAVTSMLGIGALVGSFLVMIARPARKRTRVIFLSCGVSFLLGDILWAVGQTPLAWIIAAFLCNVFIPFIGANLVSIMRTKVPIEMQGRVFSARDTLQYATIPVGIALGGFLADHVLEPFMAGGSGLSRTLSLLVGTGQGSGMAVLFIITGFTGSVVSFLALRKPIYWELDE